MWFTSQMDKTSSKSKRSNIITPLAWPVYVTLGAGTLILTISCNLLPNIFGIILFVFALLIYLIGLSIGLFLYYRQYYIAYKEDKSSLNSEGTNIDREIIRCIGQTGITNGYGLKIPESDYIIDNSVNKTRELQ